MFYPLNYRAIDADSSADYKDNNFSHIYPTFNLQEQKKPLPYPSPNKKPPPTNLFSQTQKNRYPHGIAVFIIEFLFTLLVQGSQKVSITSPLLITPRRLTLPVQDPRRRP